MSTGKKNFKHILKIRVIKNPPTLQTSLLRVRVDLINLYLCEGLWCTRISFHVLTEAQAPKYVRVPDKYSWSLECKDPWSSQGLSQASNREHSIR